MTELFDCRNSFAKALLNLARHDPWVITLCNDSVSSTKLTDFAREFPERLVNVGIAEQNMVGIAAGLAKGASSRLLPARPASSPGGRPSRSRATSRTPIPSL